MQEAGLLEIIPSLCTSVLWDQYPVLSHPGLPQGTSLEGGGLQWLAIWWWASVSTLSFLGAHPQEGCNVMAWWLQHPLFTDMAVDFFIETWKSGTVLVPNLLPFHLHLERQGLPRASDLTGWNTSSARHSALRSQPLARRSWDDYQGVVCVFVLLHRTGVSTLDF